MSFEYYDLLIWLTKYIKFMIKYILQYEIPLQVKFLKSRSIPIFLGYDLINIISSNMELKLVFE